MTTHCVVFAQLIVWGKRYGTKSFVVQLRDTPTYNLTPGINISDIGKNMDRGGIDSGWIQFTNVRIPRTNMLMKHTKVSRAGEVKEPPMAQLTYGALIQGRGAMVVDSGNIAKNAVSTASRYAAGSLPTPMTLKRPNSLTMPSTKELMDKLELTQPDDASMGEVVYTLKETHAISAGLKAFCTWSTLNAIEACRQTLGGHGYYAYTEGANYLNHLDTLLTQGCAVKTFEEILDFDVLQQAWGIVTANVVKKAAMTLVYRRSRQNSWFLLRYRYFTPLQMDFVRSQVNVLCNDVRQEYISLIGEFNYSDYMINATLGVYDGNVCEKYFDQVKRQNPVGQPHLYLTLIQSLLHRDIEDD
ncbi:acyl-CoA oxidase-domain-containing protein [Dissophora ornata]|nr:fatty-acyl coenzyme A oxidase [Dissophora ornata]KAI8605224.1 acyl-CoA oxidase-domain-containing protein [Dissophora ornata]